MRCTYILLAGLVVVGLGACSRAHTNSESESPPAKPAIAGQTATAFNVPGLVHHNIDFVRRQLGEPQEAKDELVGADPSARHLQQTHEPQWVNTFTAQGMSLVVTFNARTRKVSDLVLVGTNEDELMRRGNLSANAADYIVLTIPEPGQLNRIRGLRIVPRSL